MNLRYLCANHRQWLTADTHRAEQAWQDWVDLGTSLCEERDYDRAIPYMGCAFELANFLLQEHWPGYTVAAVRFSDCARALMEAYRRRGDENQRNYILVGASSRLARELKDRHNHQITADCIRALYAGETGPRARQEWQQGPTSPVGLH